MVEILRQGGALAVAYVLWRVAEALWGRYKAREDVHLKSLAKDNQQLAGKKDELQDSRAETIDSLHRHYAEQIAQVRTENDEEINRLRRELTRSQDRRVAEQRMITQAAVAQGELTDLLREAFDTLKSKADTQADDLATIKEITVRALGPAQTNRAAEPPERVRRRSSRPPQLDGRVPPPDEIKEKEQK